MAIACCGFLQSGYHPSFKVPHPTHHFDLQIVHFLKLSVFGAVGVIVSCHLF